MKPAFTASQPQPTAWPPIRSVPPVPKEPVEGFRDLSLFIVGNPRSGTTMMSRILGNHPQVHAFPEIHFFEKLWSPGEGERRLSGSEAMRLLSTLLQKAGEREVTCNDGNHPFDHAETMLRELHELTAPSVYRYFLNTVPRWCGKTIPCEQTPWYIYYVPEILHLFPGARIIHMVRDPRDVLLSQKKKWRRFLRIRGKDAMKRTLRNWWNYHPVKTSGLWNAAVREGLRHAGNGRVYTLRYEDVLNQPEKEIAALCRFLGLSFHSSLLDVPVINSSLLLHVPGKKGVDPDRTGHWRTGLTETEAYLCQRITGPTMRFLGYRSSPLRPSPFLLGLHLLTLPFKAGISFWIHQQSIANVLDSVKRRLGSGHHGNRM